MTDTGFGPGETDQAWNGGESLMLPPLALRFNSRYKIPHGSYR